MNRVIIQNSGSLPLVDSGVPYSEIERREEYGKHFAETKVLSGRI